MKEYAIIRYPGDVDVFVDAVNEMLQDGWELYGKTFVGGSNNTILFQAVTREITMLDREEEK